MVTLSNVAKIKPNVFVQRQQKFRKGTLHALLSNSDRSCNFCAVIEICFTYPRSKLINSIVLLSELNSALNLISENLIYFIGLVL